jgi:hypothetical protein
MASTARRANPPSRYTNIGQIQEIVVKISACSPLTKPENNLFTPNQTPFTTFLPHKE